MPSVGLLLCRFLHFKFVIRDGSGLVERTLSAFVFMLNFTEELFRVQRLREG